MRTRLSLNLSVARACFTRCSGCYNHFGSTPEMMSTPALLEFLAYVRARGLDRVTVCGGDPLSRPDILTLLEGIRRLGFGVNLDTVGTPLLGEAQTLFYGRSRVAGIDPARLSALVDLIGIPLDGASDETIATFRAGRPGLLAELLGAIDLLSAAGGRVCVNTVVHRRNLAEVPAILPLLLPRAGVVKWQLFQFAPTGPLGFRNRETFAIADADFRALERRMRAAAAEAGWAGQLECKSNTDRRGNYLMVDSEGLAWVPLGTLTGPGDPSGDASDKRVVLGDIRRAADHDLIVRTLLDPLNMLPALGTRTPRTAPASEDHAPHHGNGSGGPVPLAGKPRAPLNGAEALAALMAARGVRLVFGYPGTSELPFCEAVDARPEMEFVNAWGDKEAAFLAGGANRIEPTRAAALLHGARGLTNALGAVAELRRNEVPLLCVVGMPSRESAPFLPPHAEPGLIAGAGAFARAAFDCSAMAGLDAEAFLHIAESALDAVARAPFGPVLLGVPQDVLTARFVPRERLEAASAQTGPREEAALEDALERMARAARPVILADDYLFRPGARADAALGELACALGAPVLQVAYRRGPMLFEQLRPEVVPTFAGPYDPGDPAHAALMEGADLLITVEDRNMYPRVVGPLPRCPKVAITSNAGGPSKNGYLGGGDVLVVGDPREVLRRLAARLSAGGARGASVLTGARGGAGAGCHPSATALVGALARGLAHAADPVLVDDSQMFGGLIAAHYGLLPPVEVFGSHGGFVGSGLATAAGIARGYPERPVVCTVGDHGFGNGVQALAAASSGGGRLLVIVSNNGASVSLRKQARCDGLSRMAGGAALQNLDGLDYQAIARGFGLASSRVQWPEPGAETGAAEAALAEAVGAALGSGRPHLLELVVPGDPAFWAGVWNVAGYEPSAAPAPSTASADAVSLPG